MVDAGLLESKGEVVKISAVVENQGDFDTDEVVQVYVKSMDSEFAVRNPQLCAFRRMFIPAKQQCSVELELQPSAFTVVDDSGKRFNPGGRYRLYVGLSQPDERSVQLMGSSPLRLEFDHR